MQFCVAVIDEIKHDYMRKELISLFAAVMITCAVSAQDVVLEKVENGHRIEIYAINNTQAAQEVTLDLTLTEVSVNVDLPVTEVVPADGKVLLATLTPEPLKAWSYKTRYKYEEYIVEKPAPPVTAEAGHDPDVSNPSNTAPEKPENHPRPFEEGPDFDDSEPVTEGAYQNDDDVVPYERQTESSELASGSSQEVPMPEKAIAEEKGVMGPPLSTDDMPIPAKYYEKPEPEMSETAAGANVFEIPAESVMTLGGQEKIVVYGQPGCPRCTMAKEYFDTNEIPFEYCDITTDKAAYQQMSSRLFESGFQGGQFIMPVIYVDETAHYSIKDLEGFLDGVASRE